VPITGEIDVTSILNQLGDPEHGLVQAPPVDPGGDDVFRASWGDIDMSTSKTLMLVPRFVWDVNGYYRALGIGWPFKPTKKELRLAYLERDGESSEYLTYVMKMLIGRKTRLLYDAMPLGKRFRDKYVIMEEYEALKEAAKELSEEEGRLVTVDEVKERYGDPDKEVARPQLNTPRPIDTWDWGHYALRSRHPEVEPLREWQRMLVDTFYKAGLVETISIGYIGNSPEDVVVKKYDGRIVIFLNEETPPTPELSESALSKYKAHQPKGIK
jgi:hypothetical protein